MTLLGLTITRAKQTAPASLQPIDNRSGRRGGWISIIREPFAGAWQRNQEVTTADALTYSAVWSCATLIASDISKLWLRLVELQNGIWVEIENPAYSPVIRKPNRYQNRIKFVEYWILSKLLHGNTYALKQRDQRGVVSALYILDPSRVTPLVAADGAVFYQLTRDNLSGGTGDVTVPASEVIHDIHVPLYHPLVGVAPIHACGLAASQGLRIQQNSEQFFANNSQPGGLITAPGHIPQEDIDRIQTFWESQYSGANVGRVAMLGDGMTYHPLTPVSAHDAQLIEQLKWTAETVCSCFHVPPYMIGVGAPPSFNNIQALNLQYYSQALQGLIEAFELSMDEGLGIAKGMGVELDLSALLRMDSAAQMDMATKGVGAAIFTPNEARSDFNKPPMAGGDALYLQQQNFSLEALSKRDQSADPFGKTPPPALPPAPDDEDDEDVGDEGQIEESSRDRAQKSFVRYRQQKVAA